MTAPRVSVCIPTYNCASFIAEAVESVIHQDYVNLEILVIDNGSEDGTQRIIEQYVAWEPRMRFLKNPKNLGMVNNWNRCLQEARGEYIKFLFGDDLLASKDALTRMVSVLDANPSVSLVASARSIIDERSQVVQVMAKYGAHDLVLPGKVAVRDGLIDLRNLIGEPSTVLFRRGLAKRGFDARYRQFVDLEMWFHLLLQGDLAYLHEPLCSFRVHDQQQTAGNLRENVQIDEQAMLLEEYGAVPSLSITALERAYMRFLPARNIWKLHARYGRLSREEALDRIRAISPAGAAGFFAFFPFYRMSKLYLSMKRRVVLFLRRRPLR